MAPSETMRAVVFRECGPPSVLTLVDDFPTPHVRRGEGLVRVMCASVNPIDWKIRSGSIPSFLISKPKVCMHYPHQIYRIHEPNGCLVVRSASRVTW